MKEIVAIVLGATSFNEKDKMVTALSEDNIYSFLARGVEKLDSKNRPSVEPLSLSRFVITSGKKGYTLREGVSLYYPYKSRNDKDRIAFLSFFQEVSYKCLSKDDAGKAYHYLKRCLELLDEGFDPYTLALIYLAKVITAIGLQIDVSGCVKCHKKSEIVGINYNDGGFVCKDHFSFLDDKKMSERGIKIIQYIFKVPLQKLDHIVFNKDECLEYLSDLSLFLYNMTSIKINSIRYL